MSGSASQAEVEVLDKKIPCSPFMVRALSSRAEGTQPATLHSRVNRADRAPVRVARQCYSLLVLAGEES